MVSQRDMDDFKKLIEESSLGTPEAKYLRSLTSVEDMERFNRRLARLDKRDKAYRLQIGVGLLFLTFIMLFLGVVDVTTDQVLHASLSGLSAGTFLATAIMTFKLPRITSASIYVAVIVGLIFQSARLALRGSWWAAAVETIAFVIILYCYWQSRKLNERR